MGPRHAWLTGCRHVAALPRALLVAAALGGGVVVEVGDKSAPAAVSAIGVTSAEYQQQATCSFLDEKGHPASCTLEATQHKMIRDWIVPEMTVLELGARYGTTTCTVAGLQGNSGKLVAVEPDASVWRALQANLMQHHCKAMIFHKFIGTAPHRIVQEDAYQTRSVLVEQGVRSSSVMRREAAQEAPSVPRIYGSAIGAGRLPPLPQAAAVQDRPSTPSPSAGDKQRLVLSNSHAAAAATEGAQSDSTTSTVALKTLEDETGLAFDTLIVSCSGCFQTFLQENADALGLVRTILLKADRGAYHGDIDPSCDASDLATSGCVDYTAVLSRLQAMGFRIVDVSKEGSQPECGQGCSPWVRHFVLKRIHSQ